jgi:hypothetical protein
MNRWSRIAQYLVLGVVFTTLRGQAEPQPQTLKVDINNLVLYNYDTFDTSQFATNAGPVASMMKTYNYHISVGDIAMVNGAPAKGTLLCTHTMFVLSPTAARGSGKAIADTSRSMVDDCSLEILRENGSPVGTIFIHGLFGGTPPPGAPPDVTLSNMIVIGGTGAFLGVHGQAGQRGPWTARIASVTEDPANRQLNGGGAESIVLQLLPTFPPESDERGGHGF